MAAVTSIKKSRSLREQVSEEEWNVRVDLAACYRLVAYYGWEDLIYTHCSARVPGPEHHFLLNPYGVMFGQVTASSLVKIDLDGNIVMDTPHEVNPAGFTIHSAIHMAKPEIACVIHTHTSNGMALSTQADGLLPLTQKSLRFYDALAYHDYEGVALDLDERSRIVRDLGDHEAMILRNHGLLTVGRTMGEAFTNMHALEKAAEAQLKAQASGARLTVLSKEVCEHTARQHQRRRGVRGTREWRALRALLDATDPSYAQ